MRLKCLLIAAFALPIFIGSKELVFETITINPSEKNTLISDENESVDRSHLYGVVSDTDGNLLEGVVVSDGYTCTATDAEGRYEIVPSEYAVHINISLPAEYEVTTFSGYPDFWKELVEGQQRYDFTLTPLPNGVESEFNLICMTDPQCQNDKQKAHFDKLYAPDIREEAAELSASLPTYGVVLGDVIWNNASIDGNSTMLPQMKEAFNADNIGFPVYIVMGNHDNTESFATSYTVANDINAQRPFETTFGPINYSFNRGGAHIVCMDNIYFTNHSTYLIGFRDDQVEWLKQDLSYVPKDKLLILCVHAPLSKGSLKNKPNAESVMKLCENFSVFHIMSGHTHRQVNYDTDPTYYEHNHGAICGAFWRGKICSDGTPNGYSVYTIKDNAFSNWYYKSAEYDRDYQIRLYHGDDLFMPGNYNNKYQFKFTDKNHIIVNVWNADSNWTVEVYENGVYSGKMIRYTDRDAWASGYLMGPKGRKPGSNYDHSDVTHLYWYKLKKNSRKTNVEIVATDGFGNVYRQTEFTSVSSSEWPDF